MQEATLLQELEHDKGRFLDESERIFEHASRILSEFVQSVSKSQLDLNIRETDDSVSIEIGRLRVLVQIQKDLATIPDLSDDERKELYAAIALYATDTETGEDSQVELRRIFVNKHYHTLEWAPHPPPDQDEAETPFNLKQTTKPHLALLAGIVLGLRHPIATWVRLSDRDKESFRKWQTVPSTYAQEYLSAQ